MKCHTSRNVVLMQCVIASCSCLQTDAVNECIRCLDNAENDQQRSSIRAVFDKKNKGSRQELDRLNGKLAQYQKKLEKLDTDTSEGRRTRNPFKLVEHRTLSLAQHKNFRSSLAEAFSEENQSLQEMEVPTGKDTCLRSVANKTKV